MGAPRKAMSALLEEYGAYSGHMTMALSLTAMLAVVFPFVSGQVSFWELFDVLCQPERHRGEWHTCNDKALKGRWHWSCCDNTKKESYCSNYSHLVVLKAKLFHLKPLANQMCQPVPKAKR